MPKPQNDFLRKQRLMQDKCFEVGLDTATQQFFDMLCLVLNDPEIMGKNVFGAKRLLKMHTHLLDRERQFREAWGHTEESDYYQEKLDEELRRIFGDGQFAPFKERYPYCKEWDYTKGTKKK